MPTTLESARYLPENGILFAPGRMQTLSGVATSALETQNSERLSWTFEEVDQKLKQIMTDIFAKAAEPPTVTTFPATTSRAPTLLTLRK